MSKHAAWLGFCHVVDDDWLAGTDRTRRLLAAALCDGPDGFRSALADACRAEGLQLIRTEQIAPMDRWLTRRPEARALSEGLSPHHPVRFTAEEGAAPQGKPPAPDDYLIITEHEIPPLPDQSAKPFWDRDWIAPELKELLFGQPEAGEPLRTYFIVDATLRGKIVGHFDLDQGRHDVPIRCLFKGDAAEELREVAPYLIDMTLPEGAWEDASLVPRFHLDFFREHWEAGTGIFVRSSAPMAEVWAHFRRFTRVQMEEDGRWVLFRFWQPLLFHFFCWGRRNDPDFLGNFVPKGIIYAFDHALSSVLSLSRRDNFQYYRNYALKITQQDIHQMRRFKSASDSRQMYLDFWHGDGNWSSRKGGSLKSCIARIEQAIVSAKENGLKSKDHIAKFVRLCEQLNETICANSGYKNINTTLESDYVAGRKLTNLEYDVKDILEGQQAHG